MVINEKKKFRRSNRHSLVSINKNMIGTQLEMICSGHLR